MAFISVGLPIFFGIQISFFIQNFFINIKNNPKKIINFSIFFFGSLIGIYPQLFVWVALGSGLDKIIENNLEAPSFAVLLFSPDIYIPIIGFIFLLVIGIILKNIFYKE